MLRFVRSTVPSLRLTTTLVEHLLGELKSCKKVILNASLNGVPQRNAAPNSNYFIRFYSSEMSANDQASPDEPDIIEVTGGDAELEHKLRVLILEAEVLRQEGKAVPQNSSIRTDNWKELLRLPSRSARKKYLEYLFKVEKKKENRMKKKRTETPRMGRESEAYKKYR